MLGAFIAQIVFFVIESLFINTTLISSTFLNVRFLQLIILIIGLCALMKSSTLKAVVIISHTLVLAGYGLSGIQLHLILNILSLALNLFMGRSFVVVTLLFIEWLYMLIMFSCPESYYRIF